jgi:hypothetical protein
MNDQNGTPGFAPLHFLFLGSFIDVFIERF